jgi:hypothetical protein
MLIRKIEFVLENCEVVIIDGKYVGAFGMSDIRKKLSRLASNYVGMSEVCHSFYIELHKDANKLCDTFGCGECETKAFDRLRQYDDITSVKVSLYDQYNEETRDDPSKDVVYDYAVCWGGDSNQENAWQQSKISKTGWLYLTIGKDLDVNTFFPKEDVDDEELADFHASMLDIGDKYWTEYQEMIEECKKAKEKGEIEDDED